MSNGSSTVLFTRHTSGLALAVALCVQFCGANAGAGLLRHFLLDESSGTTMTDATVNQNGTYVGSPGLNGNYLSLNGTTQRGELSSTGSGIFNTAYETDRSLAMWIRLDNTAAEAYLLGTTIPAGGNGWSFRYLADGTLDLLRHGLAAHPSTVASGITAGTWTHVGYSLSGTTLKFYVNGVQLGADVVAATGYENNGTPVISLGAGGGDPSPTSFMAGAIDDVRFYVNGFGANDNDPDVANENGGVLSAADFAALAALVPVPEPGTAVCAVLGGMLLLVARRRTRSANLRRG